MERGVDFCVWQVILAVFLIAVVVSIGLMILFRWNFFRWLGWVLAPVSIAYFLFTCVWGLNYYNRPIQESMKLETGDYTVADLRDATEFYRQQADRLAGQMNRDENGDLILADLDTLNQSLETAFDNLVWDYSIFPAPGTGQGLGMGQPLQSFRRSRRYRRPHGRSRRQYGRIRRYHSL